MSETGYFPIERNRYFYGKLLTVRDFEKEQNYVRIKQRIANRVLYGSGVVCGLGVVASDDNTLTIESGMALDDLGREILLEEPLIRRLSMLEGYESILGRQDAYLCLNYAEQNVEPVNAVSTAAEEARQFNLTREAYRLYLSAQTPDYRAVLEQCGWTNVNTLFTSNELTLVLGAPEAVTAGKEFTLRLLIVRNEQTPPVHFTLQGESGFAETEDGTIRLDYHQSSAERRCVTEAEFSLTAQSLCGMTRQLFPNGAELNVELGNHQYKNYVSMEAPVCLCEDYAGELAYQRRNDGLQRHLSGHSQPIYLAKLELVSTGGSVFLSSVTDLPFGQMVRRSAAQAQSEGAHPDLAVSTEVHSLEYWQNPDVKASFQSADHKLHLEFGIPTPEQYDYAVCHGAVDIPLPAGNRVNIRCFSDEIPHGLGAGAVDVRLSIEYLESSEMAMVCGNSEVFRSKRSPMEVPWAEAAAIVYPTRGTMRIGLWLHDAIRGDSARVHYFAQKPERDTAHLLESRKAAVSVEPEVARVRAGEQLRFKAVVVGSDDKRVNWMVTEENGGSIDRNGIYQAPELPGTYEVTAASPTDSEVTASAFVIVE